MISNPRFSKVSTHWPEFAQKGKEAISVAIIMRRRELTKVLREVLDNS